MSKLDRWIGHGLLGVVAASAALAGPRAQQHRSTQSWAAPRCRAGAQWHRPMRRPRSRDGGRRGRRPQRLRRCRRGVAPDRRGRAGARRGGGIAGPRRRQGAPGADAHRCARRGTRVPWPAPLNRRPRGLPWKKPHAASGASRTCLPKASSAERHSTGRKRGSRRAEAEATAQWQTPAPPKARPAWYVVRAPYAGVVRLVVSRHGAAPLLTLYDPSALRVTAAIPRSVVGVERVCHSAGRDSRRRPRSGHAGPRPTCRG